MGDEYNVEPKADTDTGVKAAEESGGGMSETEFTRTEVTGEKAAGDEMTGVGTAGESGINVSGGTESVNGTEGAPGADSYSMEEEMSDAFDELFPMPLQQEEDEISEQGGNAGLQPDGEEPSLFRNEPETSVIQMEFLRRNDTHKSYSNQRRIYGRDSRSAGRGGSGWIFSLASAIAIMAVVIAALARKVDLSDITTSMLMVIMILEMLMGVFLGMGGSNGIPLFTGALMLLLGLIFGTFSEMLIGTLAMLSMVLAVRDITGKS